MGFRDCAALHRCRLSGSVSKTQTTLCCFAASTPYPWPNLFRLARNPGKKPEFFRRANSGPGPIKRRIRRLKIPVGQRSSIQVNRLNSLPKTATKRQRKRLVGLRVGFVNRRSRVRIPSSAPASLFIVAFALHSSKTTAWHEVDCDCFVFAHEKLSVEIRFQKNFA